MRRGIAKLGQHDQAIALGTRGGWQLAPVNRQQDVSSATSERTAHRQLHRRAHRRVVSQRQRGSIQQRHRPRCRLTRSHTDADAGWTFFGQRRRHRQRCATRNQRGFLRLHRHHHRGHLCRAVTTTRHRPRQRQRQRCCKPAPTSPRQRATMLPTLRSRLKRKSRRKPRSGLRGLWRSHVAHCTLAKWNL